MEPSAHQPALFLIQTGISEVLDSIVGILAAIIRKEEVVTVDLELPY